MALENADLEADLYYVDERAPLQVRKRPVNQYDETSGAMTGSTMGFVVCECDPDVEGAAEEIARCLNRLPKAEAVLIDVVAAIRSDHGATMRTAADAAEAWMCS